MFIENFSRLMWPLDNRLLLPSDSPAAEDRAALKALIPELEWRKEHLTTMPIYLALSGCIAALACCVVTFPYLALQIACALVSAMAIVGAVGIAVHCRHLEKLPAVKFKMEACEASFRVMQEETALRADAQQKKLAQ